MKFLGRVLSTLVAIILFIGICILIFIGVGALVQASQENENKIADQTILELKLNYPLKDYSGNIKYKDFPFLNENKRNGLYHLKTAIAYAAQDDNIEGISIELGRLQAGLSQLKALREALIAFKESGKFITAYSDIYTQKAYYLSSVADTIYLNPTGDIQFKGLATQILYFKDFQEKSGVKMNVIRIGKYKSAVEPFLRNTISEANKEQVLSYLNSIWGNLKQEIGKSRGLSEARLDSIAENLLARNPQRALKVGLVDELLYYSDYNKLLKKVLGVDPDDKLTRLSLRSYSNKIGKQLAYQSNSNEIAVIYAQGEIIYGKGTVDKIAPDEMNAAIKKAADDEDIKAIVLRVNSPGGSALASELIWKALDEAKKKKPVIVSMGNYAASGGYYISSGADYIFAEPTTVTGSIGVFGLLPNVSELADEIGINAEQVKTNDNAISYSLFEEMSDAQRKYIKEGVKKVYHQFKTRVSEGRGLSMEEVQAIAQGRVWTGEQALKNGLVDELGGLDEALAYAAAQAGIESYEIQEYPVFEVDLKKMFQKYGLTMSQTAVLKEAMGEEIYTVWQEVKHKTEMKGIQLLFPYSTTIR